MAIKAGDKDLFPYLGDYRPINIYTGENKIAGWKWAEQSGEELHFENTYNDFVHVEVDGKSYQHAGSGKNLHRPEKIIDDNNRISGTSSSLARSRGDRYWHIDYMDIKPNTQYTFSIKTDAEYEDGVFYHVLDEDYELVLGSGGSSTSVGNGHTFTTPLNSKYIRYSFQYGLEDSIQFEEGSTATAYEPPAPSPDYPVEIHNLNDFDMVSSTEKLTKGQLEAYDYDTEYDNVDKINLSLSEPLRSVGDVKDRLIRDSDGMWQVERNVELIYPEDGTRTIEETYDVLDSPIYEVLPQDYQDKLNNLRSFRDSNYVYTIINKADDLPSHISESLKPTMHVQLKVKGI